MSVLSNGRQPDKHELKAAPCLDCGLAFDPICMDFDHRDGETKHKGVSEMVKLPGFSIEQVLAEIEKCDLVCSNCHRIRTRNRGYSGRGLVP